MQKLFFDDERQAPDGSWVTVRTVEYAKRVLEQKRFDVLSLDHDIQIGGAVRMSPGFACEGCATEIAAAHRAGPIPEHLMRASIVGCEHIPNGTQLAHWMADTLVMWPRLIFVHSSNPRGAAQMLVLLNEHTNVRRISYAELLELKPSDLEEQ